MLVKLWHAVNGLYLWEFVTTLDYEWSVIRRRRPYRWTIWIYSLARVACAIGAILSFVGMDVETPFDCQLWVTSELILAYLSTAAASLLIVLRMCVVLSLLLHDNPQEQPLIDVASIAIWNKNKVVTVTAYSIWGINVAFLIQAIARLESTWTTAQDGCVVLNSETGVPTLISIVVTDVALLLIMLVGLLRSCRNGDGMFGLTRFLWKQGVIWLLIAAAAEIPPVVFIILNLNDPFNLMFQVPSLITMTIAATRMHRYLVDFATGPFNAYEILLALSYSHPSGR
ncbi:hypothetical protein BC826DRAFT_170495 [Russula brevipes]|nr:hypothetical protein BC826DRAFT_170495 [Russula brevipes]